MGGEEGADFNLKKINTEHVSIVWGFFAKGREGGQEEERGLFCCWLFLNKIIQ